MERFLPKTIMQSHGAHLCLGEESTFRGISEHRLLHRGFLIGGERAVLIAHEFFSEFDVVHEDVSF